MTQTTHWIIEPRDPAVIGDGRSIGATTMNRSLDVPWPGSVAGLFRTRAGTNAQGHFVGNANALREELTLKGPLLVRLPTVGTQASPAELLVPAPLDAVHMQDEGDSGKVTVRALQLETTPVGHTDLSQPMRLVTMPGSSLAKPFGRAPRYWTWTAFENWLSSPHAKRNGGPQVTDGLAVLTRERRTHVVVKPDTRTVEDGKLFVTEGVRYTSVKASGPTTPSTYQNLGLLAAISITSKQQVTPGPVGLGGERRLSFLSDTKTALPKFPDAIIKQLSADHIARVVLLTPAFFAEGAIPVAVHGATVIGARVDRPIFISGWDYQSNTPKASRRAAPAGSVYWVDLKSVGDIGKWARDIWLTNISTSKQDQRDGYGLAAVGVQ